MPPTAEIAVDAALTARNRRRDRGLRRIIESLQCKEGRDNGGEFSQNAHGDATVS